MIIQDAQYYRNYRKLNGDRIREQERERRKMNKDLLNEKKRKYRRLNREKLYESTKIYRENNPEIIKKSLDKYKSNPANKVKISARYILNKEIKLKNIFRPKNCSKCNSNKNIQAHHEDYTKPLEVIWLCSICHGNLD